MHFRITRLDLPYSFLQSQRGHTLGAVQGPKFRKLHKATGCAPLCAVRLTTMDDRTVRFVALPLFDSLHTLLFVTPKSGPLEALRGPSVGAGPSHGEKDSAFPGVL